MSFDLDLYRKLANTYDVDNSEENAINNFVKQSNKIYQSTLSLYDVLAPSDRGDAITMTNLDKVETSLRAVMNYKRDFDVETMPTGLQRVFLPKDSSEIGYMITLLRTGKKYIIESRDENRYDYDDVYVRLAGTEIKWKDENGDTITTLASKSLLSEPSTGIVEGDNIRLLRAKMKLMVQNNSDTEKLIEGQRLYLGKKVYEISYIDDFVSDGLLNIYLKHDEINKDTDDVTNGIADVTDGDNENPSNPW